MFLTPTLVILSLRFFPAATVAQLGLHGRLKNWRDKRAEEKCYLGEVKRVMAQAELAGLLTNK
ncbi:hypothetical protein OBB00_05380 [Gammaproteobacteria bacterium]|nr:hypothetical protein [Gammaproteobacteria bacterium]